MKVPLKQRRLNDPRIKEFSVKTSIPFVENTKGVLIHRVAAVIRHDIPWLPAPGLSVTMWCGSNQNGSDKFIFHEDPPREKLLCQRCEVMAKLCGQPSADELAGRHVHKGMVKAIQTCCCTTTTGE